MKAKSQEKLAKSMIGVAVMMALGLPATVQAAPNFWQGTSADDIADVTAVSAWSSGSHPFYADMDRAGVINLTTGAPWNAINDAVINFYNENLDFPAGLSIGRGAGQQGASAWTMTSHGYARIGQDLYPATAAPENALNVGAQGGVGRLSVNLPATSEPDYYYDRLEMRGGLGIGVDSASDGQVDITGAGMLPRQLSMFDRRNAVSMNFMGANETYQTRIGAEGGQGVLNINGAGFTVGFDEWHAGNKLFIGSGADSQGVVNILGSGKLAAISQAYQNTEGWSDDMFPNATIGRNGGHGEVRVAAVSGSEFRNMAQFMLGLHVGDGGTGTLEVLSSGKVANGYFSYGSSCAAAPAVPSLRIGRDDAVSEGLVRVSGANAELQVGGRTANPMSAQWEEVAIAGDRIGRIQIDAGGRLVSANQGVVKVGAIVSVAQQDPDSDQPYYDTVAVGDLGDVHIADGGAMYYGAAEGSPVPAGSVQARSIVFSGGTGEVVFNHTDAALNFGLALQGNGKLIQRAGTTVVPSTLSTAQPTAVSGVWKYPDANTIGCSTPPARPGDQAGFTGVVQVEAGRLILPESAAFPNITATTIQGGVLQQGNTQQLLGALTVSAGGELDLQTGDGTTSVTDVATASSLAGGGKVLLDTTLAGDGSPSDILRVTGAVSGQTTLSIRNFNGAGALAPNGILVVEAPAAGADAFVLEGGYIDQGDFRYVLEQRGENWYLVGQDIPVTPALVDDVQETDVDVSITFNVNGNDTWPAGSTLTAPLALTPTAHGMVSCTAAGACEYTPAPGYVGADAFSYTVCNDTACETAEVAITIKGQSLGPVGSVQPVPSSSLGGLLGLGGLISALGVFFRRRAGTKPN